MKRILFTVAGAEHLQNELDDLKNRQRPAISAAIAKAREHGDLRENAEYQAAREKQGFCEGRIGDLENKLARAEIIDVTKINAADRVVFGATVVVHDQGSDEILRYCLVGEDEADVNKGHISFSSPVGRALIGKSVGDTVEFAVPGGSRNFVIREILYI